MRRTILQKAVYYASLAALVAAVGKGALAWSRSGKAIVRVEWQTASEFNTLGFNLYRSESPEGPFEKANQDLILARNDPVAGGSYNFTDQVRQPGMTVYYQLEEVETGGATSRHGPIQGRSERVNQQETLIAVGLAVVGALGLALVWPIQPKKKTADHP